MNILLQQEYRDLWNVYCFTDNNILIVIIIIQSITSLYDVLSTTVLISSFNVFVAMMAVELQQ